MVSKGVFDIRGKGFLFTCYFALNHLYHFDLPSRFVPPREFCPSFRVLGLTTFRNWIPFKHVSELAGLYPCQRQLFSTYKSINHPTKAKLPKSLTLHKGTHTYIYHLCISVSSTFPPPLAGQFPGFPDCSPAALCLRNPTPMARSM